MTNYLNQQWISFLWRMACGALTLLALTSCAARTTVNSVWQEPRSTSIPFNHVLVVGVSPNSRMRRSFELEMSTLIAAGDSRASASIQAGSATQALSPETVAEMIRAAGADAVLVTRLLNRTVALVEAPGRVGVKAQQPTSLSGSAGVVELFTLDYNEYDEPGELTAPSTAILESSVYEAADGGRLVYTITTTSSFKEGTDDIIADVTYAIAKQLRRDGLIR